MEFNDSTLLLVRLAVPTTDNTTSHSLLQIRDSGTSLRMHGDWNALGDALYRKWHVYDMGWVENKIRIEDYHLAGAPYGGPIALIRDDRKVPASSEDGDKSKLRIFTSAGEMISEVLLHLVVYSLTTIL